MCINMNKKICTLYVCNSEKNMYMYAQVYIRKYVSQCNFHCVIFCLYIYIYINRQPESSRSIHDA